jgi:NAD(P)H-hydrate repair Nnr-like enzyme with NAD(P)H-hydrate epimerase domain
MNWLGKLSVLVALALASLAVLGCGGVQIDHVKEEALIEENLQKTMGQKVASVECPSGVPVEKGKTFECRVKLKSGREETVTMKVLNSSADTGIESLRSGSGK